jgi:hypothetical protein
MLLIPLCTAPAAALEAAAIVLQCRGALALADLHLAHRLNLPEFLIEIIVEFHCVERWVVRLLLRLVELRVEADQVLELLDRLQAGEDQPIGLMAIPTRRALQGVHRWRQAEAVDVPFHAVLQHGAGRIVDRRHRCRGFPQRARGDRKRVGEERQRRMARASNAQSVERQPSVRDLDRRKALRKQVGKGARHGSTQRIEHDRG